MPSRPATDVGDQLLERGQGALAAAQGDGPRDLATRSDDPLAQSALEGVGATAVAGGLAGLVADQLAEVGDQLLAAGLDEPVVVERVEVVLDDVGLLGHHPQQCPQGMPLGFVALPVDLGDQLEQPVASSLHTHGVHSSRARVSGRVGSTQRIVSGLGRIASPSS
jgi:hypothetical protein